MSIAIVGDSYVRRLEEYLIDHRLTNLRIDGGRATCVGQGGAAVRGRKPIIRLINRVLRIPNLHIVYINVGSNDLCDRAQSPEGLARDLQRLANFILASSEAVQVIIGQIHPRLNMPDRDYNRRVEHTNACLAYNLRHSSRIHFAALRGLRQPEPDSYCDGIHFNAKGNRKLFRGIRGAVIERLHSHKPALWG